MALLGVPRGALAVARRKAKPRKSKVKRRKAAPKVVERRVPRTFHTAGMDSWRPCRCAIR